MTARLMPRSALARDDAAVWARFADERDMLRRGVHVGMRVRHAQEVALVVRPASEEAKPIVRRLLELNAYDFSAIDGRDIGPDGEYGYPYLDHYWGAANERAAFLFHVDGHLAGFALVRLGTPHQVAEFLVLPKYRRHGLGAAAARQILSRWPGGWITHEVPGNDGAVAFSRRAIPVHFTETSDATGTTQRFVITKQQSDPAAHTARCGTVRSQTADIETCRSAGLATKHVRLPAPLDRSTGHRYERSLE